MTIPLLIDTDPGVDDAIAIWLALAAPEIDVLGLTAVLGNGPVGPCAENAIRILDVFGRDDVPVHVGAAQPLARSYARKGWGVHGVDGLGGIGLAAPSRKVDGEDAVGWMAGVLAKAAAHSITLAPLGPLTNIARLLQDHPAARRGIKEMIVMGGATRPEGGNATPHAEYNFWLDPEAADIVCASGVPITLVTIETARPVSATPARIARIEAAGSKGRRARRRPAARLCARERRPMPSSIRWSWPICCARISSEAQPARFRVETGAIRPRLVRPGLAADAPGGTPHRLLQAPDPDAIFDLLAARFQTRPLGASRSPAHSR
jgi:inosine-uridine nucleoside N-ribohydrolase